MNLLLLLSALLSALSGLGGNARAPVAVQAMAEVGPARAPASVAARTVASRPWPAMPSLAGVAPAPAMTAAVRPTIEPLWATRRRE